MAYMSQEKKAAIKSELDKVIPKGWKWSLGVRHHSTIVLTIQSAPFDLVEHWERVTNKSRARKGYEPLNDKSQYIQVNEFYLEDQFDGEVLPVMQAIRSALNLNNHDKSDPMTDYFDVGHYVSINIGRFEKPFKVAA